MGINFVHTLAGLRISIISICVRLEGSKLLPGQTFECEGEPVGYYILYSTIITQYFVSSVDRGASANILRVIVKESGA